MKKSKIIGISLGLVSLTTIATAAPLIITSCSNDKGVINQETGLAEVAVQNTAIQFASIFVMEDGQEVGLQILNKNINNNSIEWTTYNIPGLNLLLVLNTRIQSVFCQRDIQAFNLDPNAKVTWTLNGWKPHNESLDENSVGFSNNKLTNNSNYKLIGNVGNIKFQVNIKIKTVPLQLP